MTGDDTRDQLDRYDRQMRLPGFGPEAQQRLQNATVLCIGAGGLGSPVITYLAGAGVGTLVLIDDDLVEVSNLHRQVIHGTSTVGEPKVVSAARVVRDLNPHVRVDTLEERLTGELTPSLRGAFARASVVVDCTDNFEVRHHISAHCQRRGIPHVWGAIGGYDAQVSVFNATPTSPVYEDIVPQPPSTPAVVRPPVLGPVVGQAGTLMATQTIALLTGTGRLLDGEVACLSFYDGRWDYVPLAADPRRRHRLLLDQWGRVARDLRVSVTDRCSLRCSYCMPADGIAWLPRKELLTDDELVRLIRLGVEQLGVRSVRLTGGEPLMRPTLEGIVSEISAMRTDEGRSPDIALTTNALGLEKRARTLADAGLRRVNVSLDSLDRARYAFLTGRDRLPRVLAGLRAARDAGMSPIKVNCVLMPRRNDADIVPLTEWCVNEGFELRFIEFMPLGPAGVWREDQIISSDEVRRRLSSAFELLGSKGNRGDAPAEVWRVEHKTTGTRGTVGFIPAVTKPFCQECTRTRLTADGAIRTCLFANTETSLRDLMRSGATDAELADLWIRATWSKPAGHSIGLPDFIQPGRAMSAIGG